MNVCDEGVEWHAERRPSPSLDSDVEKHAEVGSTHRDVENDDDKHEQRNDNDKHEQRNDGKDERPNNEPPPPPDGGIYAWLSVFGSCLALFNAWGLVQAFGAYQSYYTTNTLRNYNASDIAWIGTIQGFLLVFVGLISGPFFDQGYIRILLLIGSFMVTFGVMMLSLATEYYQILLSQAICVGLGSGMLFTPAVAHVTVLFKRKRPIALSLTTAGVGLGGIVYPIVFDRLEPRIGFAWATRVIGFIALATLTTATTILGWKKPLPKPRRSLFDLTALKEPPFLVFCIAIFLMFTAYWVPWFYIPLFGEFGAGASRSLSFYLLSITNAASIVGRIVTSLFQRKFSPLHLLVAATILSGILVWSWISIHQLGNFVAFCVLWGLFSGPMAVLPISATADLSPSLDVVGARWGVACATSSIGVLIGTPIAGAGSNPRKHDFLGAQAYAGACLFASTGLYALALILARRAKAQSVGK